MASSEEGVNITLETTVRVTSDQVSCDLEDEAVLLHLGSGTYYNLNRLGGEIWKLIQEPRSVSEIRDWILSEYEVDAEQCEADLRAWLEEMLGRGLVEIVNTEGV